LKSKILFLLATLPIAAAASTVSSGTATIPGTFEFDFDAGALIAPPSADVFWEQFTSTTRALEPIDGAEIVNIGIVSFAGVTVADLQALSYGTAGIDGSDLSNILVPGDVFAVETNAGNFSKVLVTGAFTSDDNGLPIQWETSSAAVPEPTTLPLICLCVAGLAAVKRRFSHD
jgi:hypothetical protein